MPPARRPASPARSQPRKGVGGLEKGAPPLPPQRPLKLGEWDVSNSDHASAQGPRPSMEDRHIIVREGWQLPKERCIAGSSAWPRCAFFGVFDGHGGVRVARVASTELWSHLRTGLATHLNHGIPPSGSESLTQAVVVASGGGGGSGDGGGGGEGGGGGGGSADSAAALPTSAELVGLVERAFVRDREEDGTPRAPGLLPFPPLSHSSSARPPAAPPGRTRAVCLALLLPSPSHPSRDPLSPLSPGSPYLSVRHAGPDRGGRPERGT